MKDITYKKISKLRFIIITCFMLLMSQMAFAYVTLPSTQYTVGIGETKFLSVPSANRGYIDKAVWACSNPNISFVKKDDAGAQIQVVKSFSGTAIVELVCVEKYTDSYNHTQAITYYKEFKISCSASNTTNPTSISFSKTELNIGDIVEIKPSVRPSNATVIYKKYTNKSGNSATIWIDWNSNVVKARGLRPGESSIEVETTNGKTATVTVFVQRPQSITFITDNKGKNLFDTNLTKSVSTMEKLINKTLQNKK